MSQYITLYVTASIQKPVDSSGKVRSVPLCVLLQRVAHPQKHPLEPFHLSLSLYITS